MAEQGLLERSVARDNTVSMCIIGGPWNGGRTGPVLFQRASFKLKMCEAISIQFYRFLITEESF